MELGAFAMPYPLRARRLHLLSISISEPSCASRQSTES